jgi:hypothetical protein
MRLTCAPENLNLTIPMLDSAIATYSPVPNSNAITKRIAAAP